jgi:hypothetical protein
MSSQSNQTAGEDRKPCAWCSVRIAVFFASTIDPPDDGRWDVRFYLLAWKSAAVVLRRMLSMEEAVVPDGCQACSDSAAIHRGEDIWTSRHKQIVAANRVMGRFIRIS